MTSSELDPDVIHARNPLRTVAILSASSLTLLALGAVAPSLPAIERAYTDVPDAAFLTRMVLTITALFMALSAPLSGILVDKAGRKPVMLVALALYLVSGTAGIWLQGLTELLVSRAVLGIASGMILTAATTLIGDYYQGTGRNRMAGAQISVMVLAVATGTMVAGFLADTNWRLPFYLYLVAVIVLPLVMFGIDEPARASSNLPRRRIFASGNRFPILRAGLIYVLICVSMASTFMIPSQVPFLLAEIGVPAPAVAGIAIGVFNAIGAVTAILFRRLRDRFDNSTILAGTYLFLGAGLLLAGTADSVAQAILGMVFAGIGFGPLMPTFYAWLLSIAPSNMRGRFVGGLTFFQFLGIFASPFYSQPLADRIDLTGAFALTGLAQIALGLAFVGAAISAVFFARPH